MVRDMLERGPMRPYGFRRFAPYDGPLPAPLPDPLTPETAADYLQTHGPAIVAAVIADVCSPDPCSEEYGPCEAHGEALYIREGAAVRTGDELAVVYLLDVATLTGVEIAPDVARIVESLDGWTADPADADALQDAVDRAPLPPDVMAVWDDGYVIYRILGGPLSR
jgi:hypothetical protein